MGQKLGNNLSQREASGVVDYLTLMTDSFYLPNPSGVWAACAIRRVRFHRWGWRIKKVQELLLRLQANLFTSGVFKSTKILVITTTLTKDLVVLEQVAYFRGIHFLKVIRILSTRILLTLIQHHLSKPVQKHVCHWINTFTFTLIIPFETRTSCRAYYAR